MSQSAQVLGMSAILQHCNLVSQLASSGRANTDEIEHCLNQLFIFDHTNIESAFGEQQHLSAGIQLLINMLSRTNSQESRPTLNYAIGVLHLERKLAAQPNMLKTISNRLEHASFNSEHFSSNNHTTNKSFDTQGILGLAAIYQDTLSTLKYRIQVQGNMKHLSDEHTANKIRALLLAAVRAARLWRLAGGSRFSLLLKRSRYEAQAQRLLKQLKTDSPSPH